MNMQLQTQTIPKTASNLSHVSTSKGLLQRACACGNHTVTGGECAECGKKKSGLQRKLAIGASHDPLEREADRIAGQVMTAAASPAVNGAPLRIQRSAGHASAQMDAAPASVDRTLASAARPLDPGLQQDMGQRFGYDFSQVRLHTGTTAEQSARDVHAHAYTVGHNIVFGAGQFAPGTHAGRQLIAHELTHVVQQGTAAVSPRLSTSAVGGSTQVLRSTAEPTLQRQPAGQADSEPEPNFDSPQQRGGRARTGFIDAGRRGADQVRIAVTRYLCDCAGRNVTRTSASARLQPRPGVTLEICNGRVTARLIGEVTPSSFSTGRATVRGEVNVAPGPGGTGARVGVEGEVLNTGSEPQVGGRVDARLRLPGGQDVGVGGGIRRGTQTGQIDTEVSGGVDTGRGRIGVTGTNLQDPQQRGVVITFGGNLPGQAVQSQVCRECRCPVVYECIEDIPPRDYEEAVTYDVEDRSRLRYYFKLDTNQDTSDPTLRGESTRMLDEVARRVAAGARIVTVTGYASPEDNRDRPTPNEQLSLSRGQKLRELLAARLGATIQIPDPVAGGELFGRVATIAPGSRLADALLSVGFGDPEDVTTFLIGNDIPNPELADQFLRLLERVTEPADRLRLFGVDATSPAAPRLLVAIEQFIRTRGRGRRPWEGVFGYLRFATVELGQTRQETRMEQRRTSGSLTPLNTAQCTPHARLAESRGVFGPAAPEPRTEAECPSGTPRNPERFANLCDYRG